VVETPSELGLPASQTDAAGEWAWSRDGKTRDGTIKFFDDGHCELWTSEIVKPDVHIAVEPKPATNTQEAGDNAEKKSLRMLTSVPAPKDQKDKVEGTATVEKPKPAERKAAYHKKPTQDMLTQTAIDKNGVYCEWAVNMDTANNGQDAEILYLDWHLKQAPTLLMARSADGKDSANGDWTVAGTVSRSASGTDKMWWTDDK
jgi:hypothetical protein